MVLTPGFEPWPNWWEVSALTTHCTILAEGGGGGGGGGGGEKGSIEEKAMSL